MKIWKNIETTNHISNQITIQYQLERQATYLTVTYFSVMVDWWVFFKHFKLDVFCLVSSNPQTQGCGIQE